eukprot:gene6883-9430_t
MTTMQNDQYYTLFLGDLSVFCMDEDVFEAFSPHGSIAEIKIMKSKKTGLGLGYGFVRYLTAFEANNAMKAMQNIAVKGRKLKISWSTDSSNADADSKVTSTPTANGIEAVVYCKFNSVERINFMIDESYLEELFSSSNGEVVCVKIKQSKNDATGKQNGYGFIHFNSDEKGIAAALQVIEACQSMVIAGVKYSCTPSRSFRTYLTSIGHPLGSVNIPPHSTNHIDHTPTNRFINNNQYSSNGTNPIRENVAQYNMKTNNKTHTTKVKNFSNRNINSGQKQVIVQKGNNDMDFNTSYKFFYYDRKLDNAYSNVLGFVPCEREYFHGDNTLQSAPVPHPQSIITESTQHSNDLSSYSPSHDLLSYPSTSSLTSSSQSNDQFSLVSSSMSSNSRSSLLQTHRYDSHTDRSTTSYIVDNRPNYGPNNKPNSNLTYFSVVNNKSKFGLG